MNDDGLLVRIRLDDGGDFPFHSWCKGNDLTSLNAGGICPGEPALIHPPTANAPVHTLRGGKGTVKRNRTKGQNPIPGSSGPGLSSVPGHQQPWRRIGDFNGFTILKTYLQGPTCPGISLIFPLNWC